MSKLTQPITATVVCVGLNQGDQPSTCEFYWAGTSDGKPLVLMCGSDAADLPAIYLTRALANANDQHNIAVAASQVAHPGDTAAQARMTADQANNRAAIVNEITANGLGAQTPSVITG